MECGEPTAGEITGEQRWGSYGERTSPRGRRGRQTSRSYSEESQSVEKWTFNCGEGDYIYVLTFVGGTLSTIESAGRGRGDSDCRGAASRPRPTPPPAPSAPASRSPEVLDRPHGTLSVYGQPHYAEVFLDGAYAGRMACTIELVTPGVHQITVKRSGFKTWRGRVSVEPDQITHLEVYLEPR